MFPVWHIALTSLITAVVTAALAAATMALRRSAPQRRRRLSAEARSLIR